MSKLAVVMCLISVVGVVGCGGDDDGAPQPTLCETQRNRAIMECSIPEALLNVVFPASATCNASEMCVAACAQQRQCAELTQFGGAFQACVSSYAPPDSGLATDANFNLNDSSFSITDGSANDPLCAQQAARAMNDCGVSVVGLSSDGGLPCNGLPLCVANCASNATCEDLQMFNQAQGPFFTCSIGCAQ